MQKLQTVQLQRLSCHLRWLTGITPWKKRGQYYLTSMSKVQAYNDRMAFTTGVSYVDGVTRATNATPTALCKRDIMTP